MSIRARCPSCDTEFNLNDRLAGKQVQCRECKEVFRVPEAGVQSEPPEEAEAPLPPRRGQGRDDGIQKPARSAPAPGRRDAEMEEDAPSRRRSREHGDD